MSDFMYVAQNGRSNGRKWRVVVVNVAVGDSCGRLSREVDAGEVAVGSSRVW